MLEDKSRTELSELGEFGLIESISKSVKLDNKTTLKGIGDDSAVTHIQSKQLITTDMLVEGVHFDLMYMPLKHLGYKAVVVNLSDIYAMNAKPSQITVSIALSNRFSLEAIDELYEGILLACKTYQVDLVGGDTCSSTSGLIISITAIGEEEGKITYRDGAKENDLIVVSGDLGGAFMGLQILEREKAVYNENPDIQPDLEGYDYILERQLKPEARADVIQILKELKIIPTSMIDISDGLASELHHICRQSGTGCIIYEDKLPIDTTTYSVARDFELDPTMCAFNGGEDYELLFTINQKDFDKIKANPDLSVIGHMTKDKGNLELITKDKNSHQIKAQGWDHLKS